MLAELSVKHRGSSCFNRNGKIIKIIRTEGGRNGNIFLLLIDQTHINACRMVTVWCFFVCVCMWCFYLFVVLACWLGVLFVLFLKIGFY